jgi:hypothetical protein
MAKKLEGRHRNREANHAFRRKRIFPDLTFDKLGMRGFETPPV